MEMKKLNKFIIIGVCWILISFYFFSVNKIGVGMAWFVVGVINLVHFFRRYRLAKKASVIAKYLEETVRTKDDEDVCEQSKTMLATIEPANEVHTIYDEYTGYGYMVDKAFKPAKSHAGEVELLCTYAPVEEYGKEGILPCIAVIDCDEVYCAVEEYIENKTFEGAISIEPQEGMFLFRAKREYYGDIMYFYGFELEEEEYWDKTGLCLVYPKEYVGTAEEQKLMHILDEAAKTFGKERVQDVN